MNGRWLVIKMVGRWLKKSLCQREIILLAKASIKIKNQPVISV
jgi:hypothetical protein